MWCWLVLGQGTTIFHFKSKSKDKLNELGWLSDQLIEFIGLGESAAFFL